MLSESCGLKAVISQKAIPMAAIRNGIMSMW